MNFIKRFWLRFWPGLPLFLSFVRDNFFTWLFLTALVSVARGEIFGYPADRSTVLSFCGALASPFMVFYVFKLFSAAKESVK